MDLDVGALHTVAAYAAVVLGVVGPGLALVYAVRVDSRDFWRMPMLVGGSLTFVAVLGGYLSGRRLVAERPGLLDAPGVASHLEYADRLLLPGAGFFVLVVLTGVLNPRTGTLRTLLPLLLTGFAVVVLVLVVLSGDAASRLLLDRLRDAV